MPVILEIAYYSFVGSSGPVSSGRVGAVGMDAAHLGGGEPPPVGWCSANQRYRGWAIAQVELLARGGEQLRVTRAWPAGVTSSGISDGLLLGPESD